MRAQTEKVPTTTSRMKPEFIAKSMDESSIQIHDRKSDGKEIDNHQKWTPKGKPKTSKFNKQHDQNMRGNKRLRPVWYG